MKTLVLLLMLVCFAPNLFAADEMAPSMDGTKSTPKPKTDLIADSANMLAEAVIKASGGDHWQNVKTLDFTFNVAGQDGKTVASVKHHWDIPMDTDTVTANGKTMTMNLNDSNTEGEA